VIAADRRLIAHAAFMTLLGLLSAPLGLHDRLCQGPACRAECPHDRPAPGALLFGLAAVWSSLGSGRVVTAARYCALIGLYANWLGAQLASFWSARGMFTVHGATMPAGAAPWMENVVFAS